MKNKTTVELWNRGDYLGAGREMFESIPHKKRPSWAVSVLLPLREKYLTYKEFDELFVIANFQHDWRKAKKIFEDIRNLFLRLEDASNIDYNIFELAENVAKVIYNESGEVPTFDKNAGWRISLNLKKIIDHLPKEDESIKKEMTSAFWNHSGGAIPFNGENKEPSLQNSKEQ